MPSTRLKTYADAGAYLRDARQARAHTVRGLAALLSIQPATLRSYLSGWSAPRDRDAVYQKIRDVLGSETQERYQRMVNAARDARANPSNHAVDFVPQLIARGRITEARTLLDLSTAEQGPDFARHYLALGRAFLDSRNVSEGTDCYLQSAAFARHVESAMSVEIICELGARLTRLENYDAAIDLLINEIASRPIDGALWHRLGVIYWYADRLIDAYAALSTALANGAGRARVAHARGQVLNEMGEYHLARNELEIALEDPLTVVSASYARAAHAYALYMLGNTGEGESEFSEAEQITPGNAWLHWLRGLAAERMGDTRGAAERFSRSLVENAPPLNSAKRVYALRYLQMYNRR